MPLNKETKQNCFCGVTLPLAYSQIHSDPEWQPYIRIVFLDAICERKKWNTWNDVTVIRQMTKSKKKNISVG